MVTKPSSSACRAFVNHTEVCGSRDKPLSALRSATKVPTNESTGYYTGSKYAAGLPRQPESASEEPSDNEWRPVRTFTPRGSESEQVPVRAGSGSGDVHRIPAELWWLDCSEGLGKRDVMCASPDGLPPPPQVQTWWTGCTVTWMASLTDARLASTPATC